MEARLATEEELLTLQPIPEPRHSSLQSRRPSTAWSGSKDLRARALQDIKAQWESLTSSISRNGGLANLDPGSPAQQQVGCTGKLQRPGMDVVTDNLSVGAGRSLSDKVSIKISNLHSCKGSDRRRIELISKNPKDDAGSLVFATAKQQAAREPRSSRDQPGSTSPLRPSTSSVKERLQDDGNPGVAECNSKRPATAGAGTRVRFADQDCSGKEDDTQTSVAPSVTWRVRTEYSDLAWIKSLVQYVESHPIYIRDESVNEVVYQPTGQWQHVIFPSACPTRREDVLLLEHWLAGILLNVEQIRFPNAAPSACHVQAASMKGLRQDNDTGDSRNGLAMAEAALVVYNTAFCEIVRQVEVNCKERSQLLWTVWTHYFHLVNALKIMEYDGQIQALHGQIKTLEGQLKVELTCFNEEEKKLQDKLQNSEQEQYTSEFVKKQLATKVLKLEKELEEARESHPRLQDHIADLIQSRINLESQMNKEVSLRYEAENEAAEQAAAAKTILSQYQTLEAELHILRRSEKVANERAEKETALAIKLQKELEGKVSMNKKIDGEFFCQKAELLQAQMKLAKLEAVEEELDRERDWHEQTKRKCDDLRKRCSDIELLHEKLYNECGDLETKGQRVESALVAAENKVSEQENKCKFLEQSLLSIENFYHQEKSKSSELQAGINILSRMVEQLHSSLTDDPICQQKIVQRMCQQGTGSNDLFLVDAHNDIESLSHRDPSAADAMSETLAEAFKCLDDLIGSNWDGCDLLIKTQNVVIASEQHIRGLRDVFRSTWRKNAMVELRLTMEVKERGDLEVQVFDLKRACELLTQSLEYEKKESVNKDIRIEESLHKKDHDIETAQSAISDLQNRITLLVEDFQHQEQNASQAQEETIALLKDHEQITDKMRRLQMSAASDKHELSRLNDDVQELQGQVAVLTQELTFEKDERDSAVEAFLGINHELISMQEQLAESENKVGELEKANETLVQNLQNAHQLIWYARAFFKNLINAKAQIECMDPCVGYGDPCHNQTVNITSLQSAAAQAHQAYIGDVEREPPLVLRLRSALLTKSNQYYRAQLALDLKNRIQSEEEMLAESRSFEDDLFIQMRCLWAEESSGLRRIIKQVGLLKAGLIQLVEIAAQIQAAQKEQWINEQASREGIMNQKILPGRDVSATAQTVKDVPEMTSHEEKPEQADPNRGSAPPLPKKVKFLADWEKRIEKLSICEEWKQDTAKPSYFASTEITNNVSPCDHKEIQVPEDLNQLDPDMVMHAVTPLYLSSDPNRVLSRKKIMKMITRIYTEGVDELERVQYVAHNRCAQGTPRDGILIKLQIIFREIHGLEEGPQKMLEFLGSCTSYLHDPKVNSFSRFCGLLQPTFDNNTFYFHLEVLYCIRQLLGVNWRAVVREWQQGGTAIPEALALCVLGNAYNVAAPQTLSVYSRTLQPLLKESRSGMLVDLDTLLGVLCQEYVEKACPVYPLACPRRTAPGYLNPTQPVEDNSQYRGPCLPPTLLTPREVMKYASR